MPERSPYSIDIPQTDVLSWLFPAGSEPSDRPIWIDAGDTSRFLSPRTLLQWVKRLGLGLRNLGLKENDVVLTIATNHIFVPVTYLGTIGHGFIFSGSNPAYRVDETKYQIENTGAKLILVDPALLDVATQAAQRANFPRDRIFLFSDVECKAADGISDWRSFLPSEDEVPVQQTWRSLQHPENKTRTAVLNYSSGTTGLSKGVCISHLNIISNVCQSLFMRQLKSEDARSYVVPTFPSDERWLGFLPLYHAYGQLWSIGAACRSLTPVYFMRSFDYEGWLRNVERHRITHVQTAPPLLVMLRSRPETARYDLGSLRNVLCGAAPLSRELQNEIMAKVGGGGLKVVQTMGMTELTCSNFHVPGLMADDSGSVGLADPGSEVKLVDEAGAEVTRDGERGEVCVRGPNVCLGYWRNEGATRAAFDGEGFLRSGDVAVRRKGWYWIVDRKKELIKVRGFQVAPAELEGVLVEHAGIADAAVTAVRVDGDEGEERPRAYVVLRDEARGRIDEQEIARWMATRVAKHKRLSGGVKLVDEVPKSASGKIQRKTMREWAARDAASMDTKAKARL